MKMRVRIPLDAPVFLCGEMVSQVAVTY
jgi:hypothetical protein